MHDCIQGHTPEDLITTPAGISENQEILMLFGFLSEILTVHFGGLESISDWENLYAVLTQNFIDENKKSGVSWETSHWMAQPMNANDLPWKTKLRFHASHQIRHCEADSQKRVSSFSCSLMGIRPVKKLSQCLLRDSKVRISEDMNPSCLIGKRADADSCNLIRNQAKRVTLHIVIDNVQTSNVQFTSEDATFYKRLSATKAIAASKAEQRSWKDCFLALCRSRNLLAKLHPADFSDYYFGYQSDMFQKYRETSVTGNGNYINDWSDSCQESILFEIYREKDTPAFKNVMRGSGGEEIRDFATFKALFDLKSGLSTSKWTFPKIIKTPKPIRTLAHLIFLTLPANSTIDERRVVHNPGLDNLLAVSTSGGDGVYEPPPSAPAFKFHISDPSYKQTVSGSHGCLLLPFPILRNRFLKPENQWRILFLTGCVSVLCSVFPIF
jgi:hypothetical protein